MDDTRARTISKLLSLALRHDPSVLGIVLDAGGWASVAAVVEALDTRGFPVSRYHLEEIVRASDKQRFAISADGSRIRANQGHSIEVDLGLTSREPPEVLHHGTVVRFLDSIRRDGLVPGARTHVHLSPDVRTAEIVAARRKGARVILQVCAGDMHRAGHPFFETKNGVWLTRHVPPEYLVVPR